MTWRYQRTLSDHIHRLGSDSGAVVWGVDHQGRDEDHPRAGGTVEVDLPTGPAALLLVDPLPGGLVLDIVRSYQGLTSGELCTLFLGLGDELRSVARPGSRLTLECLGLDAEGHPRLIPGVGGDPSTSARRALGEMLYHAAFGAPWKSTLLPVDIALQQHPEPLRHLVADLLNDPPPDDARRPSTLPASPAGVDDALAEVSACLRSSIEPIPLPLLPAERDLDPGQALTARLRAGSVLDGLRRPSTDRPLVATSRVSGTADATRRGTGPGPATGEAGGSSPSPRGGRHGEEPPTDPARRLRRASRRKAPGRRLLGSLPRRMTWPVRPSGILLLIAVCIALFGSTVMVQSWSSQPGAFEDTSGAAPADDEAAAEGGAAKDGGGSSPPTGTRASAGTAAPPGGGPAAQVSDEEAFGLLEDLCARRAQALRDGDASGLRQLTVPESTAAVADELIDVGAFAGNDYTIDVDSLRVTDRSGSKLVIAARMTTSAAVDGEVVSFDARQVEFHLSVHSGEWKVAEVIESSRR